MVEEGPAVLAAGAGWECWLYFFSHLSCLSFSSPFSDETARLDNAMLCTVLLQLQSISTG